jgi:hypothetical protein
MTAEYLTRRRSKLGIDATKKIPGEGFKRPWPPLIKMDAAVKAKVGKLSTRNCRGIAPRRRLSKQCQKLNGGNATAPRAADPQP